MVADNDPDALELAVTDLRLEGHEIVGTATDGDSAAALVAELLPDIVVLDYRMPPGPSGLDIAARLREETPEVAVLIYSNYQNIDLVRRARDIGVAFLPKGNLRNLRRAVTEAGRQSG